ncbi:hypothetical protein [Streptococcus henryi]|uniref:hypothetical protein n=1 Tax=Streptococcus henryi TaxID=439219 RepID=UPI0003624421|nr:hypothetical protein [Streptococcus henryi]
MIKELCEQELNDILGGSSLIQLILGDDYNYSRTRPIIIPKPEPIRPKTEIM